MAEQNSAVDNEVRLPSASPTGSQRITRSSARQAANQAASPHATRSSTAAALTGSAPAEAKKSTPQKTPSTRKRKTTSSSNSGSKNSASSNSQPGSSGRPSKRQKIPGGTNAVDTPVPTRFSRKGKSPAAMDSHDNTGTANPPERRNHSASSSRKSSRSKKVTSDGNDTTPVTASSSTRKSKRTSNVTDPDTAMTGTDETTEPGPPPPPPPPMHPPEHASDDDDEDEDGDDDEEREYDEDDFFGAAGAAGITGTLRALTGMMTGFSSRLKDLLNKLRSDDETMQLIALQELSETLLISNEDNLSGQISLDAFVKELVALMNKEDNADIMLLACRCLANLMEALPASVANVVYGGAVPVLCQKLLEISFIDVAEQALSTLEKISSEYPGSIVREGGLTACLTYLDFFATGTQRTAVTTAANCCRNIPEDSFGVVRDVMPVLLNVLNSSDQRVVEQASLCVSGIVDCFGYRPGKLEELVSVDLLRAVLRLLVPGSTNLIGSGIHTQFLRVLALTAKASPRLSAELFKLNIVDTLYQILTGVSPPTGTQDVASKLDSVVIMQALIHRPREQILETLNVICELLPNLPKNADPASGDFVELNLSTAPVIPASSGRRRRYNFETSENNEKRAELLKGCPEQVRRFALILFPTLTDAYSSTVNLAVRQRVLTAQLKMLSNVDREILVEALIPVPYASFLASILSQQDHPTLVLLGLQATELLLNRLDDIYRYQFYREGVIHEITLLGDQEDPEETKAEAAADSGSFSVENAEPASNAGKANQPEGDEENHHDDEAQETSEDDDDHDPDDEDEEDDEDHDEDENEENDPDAHPDDVSPVSSRGSTMSLDAPFPRYAFDTRSMKSRIRHIAKKFIETHESEDKGQDMRNKANVILDELSKLAGDLESFYLKRTTANLSPEEGRALFTRLASHFDTDVLESITSAELLASGLVRVLLEIFSNPDNDLTRQAQSTFLEVFMGSTVNSKPKTATADSPATPFSVMVHKLQDLLSRSEHFEVITVHQNTFDGSRSSPASMLGKQIRLKLVADEDGDIPKSFRNIMVSIHAIATFKSLEEYLRPRINLSERPRGSRRDGLSRALAAMAGAGGFPLSGAAAARMAERSPFGSGLLAGGPPPPPPAAPTPSSSRSARKSKGRPQNEDDTSPGNPMAESPSDRGSLRRSSRRYTASDETPPPRPPPTDDDQPQDTLECADEKQLTDDEDEMGNESALDAIVGELQDDMDEDEPPHDPSAVNMEVANGGNVTARKEDGSRVPTPRSGLTSRSAGLPSGTQSTPTPAPSSSRAMSYASALQAAPKDWHIEFSLEEKVIPNETTIYRAVHTSGAGPEEGNLRSVWSAIYEVKFRKVPGPPPAEPQTSTCHTETDAESGLPVSLAKHPTTTSILQLLNVLHDLNANVEDVLIEKRNTVIDLHREPISQFVNTKLTAKLNRQLEEPLIVASNCLPGWAEDLARLYPFLFPFETRHLFLQSTSFGYARSMTRWQSTSGNEDSRRDRYNERPFLGRLQRQKVRISRSKILESALKVMDLYGASQSILEVEYFEEVGTGLGPTLEFYSTVSQEFSKKKLKLWRDMDSTTSTDFVSGQTGLFPRPLSEQEASTPNGERILHLFKMLGKFVARSMIDSRIIDIHFNPVFFRIWETTSSGVKPSLASVKMVDPGLARSLMTIKNFAMAKKEIDEDPNRSAAQKVTDVENIEIDNVKLDDLCLDFTLPGYPEIELEEDGAQKRVTIDNVGSYIEKVVDVTLGLGVRRQVDAFRAGFSTVFPYSALSAFTPEELVNLFGRADEDWSLETLVDSIKADHGYNMDSPSVRHLLQLMSDFDSSERRDFLQFTTGSPKLPIGGFKSLTPMFTVVCKPSEEPYTSDDYLPSVMTCVNYLKLPNYTTVDSMRKQLSTAMKEGQGAFHLS